MKGDGVFVCGVGGVHIREMKRGGPAMASEMPPCWNKGK